MAQEQGSEPGQYEKKRKRELHERNGETEQEEMNEIKQRNSTIDILRVIGLLLVIAAHCEFPEWFYELREFDVVTLAAISGMAYYLTAGRTDETYGAYVKKRFRKLVLPVWIFLIFFFLFFRLLGRSFSPRVIAESFLLLAGGILFIWVYRIFFVNALLNPLLKRMAEKYTFTVSSAILIAGLAVNELLYHFARLILPGTAGKLFDYIVIYTLGYGLISFAGMLWEKEKTQNRLILLGIAGAAFAVSVIAGGFHGFYESKYPPQLYYISYGLFVTFALYLVSTKIKMTEPADKIITWLSVNTMRIYMWHIFLYYLLDTLSPSFMDNPWPTYGILLGGSIVGSLIQDKLFKLITKKR